MHPYILLLIADTCVAAQFNLSKLYQRKYAHGMRDDLTFPMVSGLVTAPFFVLVGLLLNRALPSVSAFSIGMAAAFAALNAISLFTGILTLKRGGVTGYTVFMMLGGMILPYIYGLVFLEEQPSIVRIIGLAAVTAALLFFAMDGGKGEQKKTLKGYYPLCMAVFMLNGTSCVLSKIHAIHPQAIPASDYILWMNLFQAGIAGTALLVYLRRHGKAKTPAALPQCPPAADGAKRTWKGYLVIAIYAVDSGIGYLLQLIPAQTVPASALYPFVTGGSILISTLMAAVWFKEKIGKWGIAGIAVAFIGTVLFMF
ncbi:MAG: EamA family transporter [Oscillospiraceae bacterium]|jgi:drug/metabolite transporter (DMT)-like permease|nr:EamA family transporter [Oscillospiraceae bacterium]